MSDLTFLKKITKGDAAKMKRYISLYLEVAPATFAEMDANISAKDWEQFRINAHSLKPQADFMGLMDLKETLINVEDLIQSRNYTRTLEVYETARSMHLEAMDVLEKALEDLGR
jgi:HPt (histidine-containing phosphotransfer) domain-containing protein